MKFRTLVDIPNYDFRIKHKDKCVFIGSCFANNIGEKMIQTKIYTQINPTGIHYNPLSVAKSIKLALSGKPITENDVFFANDLWNSFDFHSSFSDTSQDDAILNYNNSLKQLKQALENASHFFVTFGTSYVYKLLDTKSIVSNCHKLPEKNFEREFLQPDKITNTWEELIEQIKTHNPEIKIIFTISPIRHLKDGATNNQMSKASLFIAVRKLLALSENLYYFPSYEIMMDDLRDYRFYAEDLTHPSNTAINYIWEIFESAFFDEETKELNKKILKIITASKHRSFNINTQSHKDFCDKMISDIAQIKKNHPELDFALEEEFFLKA